MYLPYDFIGNHSWLYKIKIWCLYIFCWLYKSFRQWESSGVLDNAPALHLLGPAFDAPLKPLVKFSLTMCFNNLSEKGVGGLEGLTGLPALQPVPHPSRFYVSGEGHGHLVYKYTWSIGCCAAWFNMPVPLSCSSWVVFKLFNVNHKISWESTLAVASL